MLLLLLLWVRRVLRGPCCPCRVHRSHRLRVLLCRIERSSTTTVVWLWVWLWGSHAAVALRMLLLLLRRSSGCRGPTAGQHQLMVSCSRRRGQRHWHSRWRCGGIRHRYHRRSMAACTCLWWVAVVAQQGRGGRTGRRRRLSHRRWWVATVVVRRILRRWCQKDCTQRGGDVLLLLLRLVRCSRCSCHRGALATLE